MRVPVSPACGCGEAVSDIPVSSAFPDMESRSTNDVVETIRAKRDGVVLSTAAIDALIASMRDPHGVADSQLAAFAMAVLLRGMNARECADLTRAMTHSGAVIDWSSEGLPGPCIDKHSTGGVGDKVSLLLAPMLAACGAFVPMVSGRGLGHTGGTLDKLEAIPGYCANASLPQLRRIVRECGCAIVGANAELAPADARLYAIRDVTATVESVALITASILSKKLAAGVEALVMDVKCGNGAFNPSLDVAREVAASLVDVAAQAGLPVTALITDMQQVLGSSAGNALEVAEVLRALRGDGIEPRLQEIVLALGVEALQLAEPDSDRIAARSRLLNTLASGAAAELFQRMVAAQGGVADIVATDGQVLPRAPVQRDVCAPVAGYLKSTDTRALGLVVVRLGGGRRRPGEAIDPRVGLSAVRPLGTYLERGEPFAKVHAATDSDADAAVRAALAAIDVGTESLQASSPILERVTPAAG